MAHFLSEVTHLRLELRTEPLESHDRDGIVHTHDFTSLMRSFAVVPRKQGSVDEIEIWSGDIDGSLTVRHGIDGRPLRTYPPCEANVFIFAICAAPPNMWIGKSDGFLEVRNASSCDKLFDCKGHVGAINAMTHHISYVFSASSDWQITMWCETTFARLCQLSAHVNAVRCMVADGNCLLSGGDDGVIHCWNLDTRLPKDALWPIRAHNDSIRSLDILEVYLFSCSNDGQIKVWNTQTAQLVRVLEKRSCAINSLFVDDCSRKLWSSSADGAVNVWDIDTLTHRCSMTDQRVTNVPLVKSLARVNSLKIWTIGTDGSVRVWYSDSDPGATEFDALAEMESQLQEYVDQYRVRIVHNYKQLEKCKSEMIELERRDTRKKEALAVALNRHKDNELKVCSIIKTLGMFDRLEKRRSFLNFAHLLHQTNSGTTLAGYFAKWRQFAALHSQVQVVQRIEQYVRKSSDNRLTESVIQKIAQFSQECNTKSSRKVVADSLAQQSQRLLQRNFFMMWLRHRLAVLTTSQRGRLANAIGSNQFFVDCCSQWCHASLGRVVVAVKETQLDTVRLLSDKSSVVLMRSAFAKMKNYVVERRGKRLALAKARVFEDTIMKSRMLTIFRQWMSRKESRELGCTRELVQLQQSVIVSLQKTLDDNSGWTESELERNLYSKQVHLANIIEENRELDEEVELLLRQRRLLQRELLRDTSVDRSAPPQIQLSKAIFVLKARGVNTHHDMPQLAAAREEVRRSGSEKVMSAGLATVRKVFSRYVKPDKVKDPTDAAWFVGETFSKIKRRGIERANAGICSIVAAFDATNPAQLNAWTTNADGTVQWDKKHNFSEEIVANLGPLLEVALRSYRYRRNEDPVTGEPKKPVEAKKVKKAFSGTKPVAKKPPKRITKRTKKKSSKTVPTTTVGDLSQPGEAVATESGQEQNIALERQPDDATPVRQAHSVEATATPHQQTNEVSFGSFERSPPLALEEF